MIKKYEEYRQSLERYDFIGEGVDIDYKNRLVTVNLQHNNGVDTSIDNNPLYTTINGFDVISIFTRKRYLNGDGNPLLYALKGLNDWEIKKYDIDLLMKQFIRICEKIDPKYDTIIKIPSNNHLNNIFMERLNKIIHCDNNVGELLTKLEADVVWLDGVVHSKMTDEELDDMETIFSDMGEFFSFKKIPPNLRKYVKKIYNDNWMRNQLDVADKINDKNVLILDDTISSGTTISLFTKQILEMYDPKKVTIITLFSKL